MNSINKSTEQSEHGRKDRLKKFKAESDMFLSAKDIMSPRIITVYEDASILDTIGVFIENKISVVIVNNKKDIEVGVFSTTDLIRFEHEFPGHSKHIGAIYTEQEITDYYINTHNAISGTSIYDKKVSDYMTRNIVSVELYESVSKCCKVMNKNHIHRVFVRCHGKIVGVLSSTDVVRALGN